MEGAGRHTEPTGVRTAAPAPARGPPLQTHTDPLRRFTLRSLRSGQGHACLTTSAHPICLAHNELCALAVGATAAVTLASAGASRTLTGAMCTC